MIKIGSRYVPVGLKARICRKLARVTCDKTELNRIVLKWKKYFDEAGQVINADRKKKK